MVMHGAEKMRPPGRLKRNPERADWWAQVDAHAADAPVLRWEGDGKPMKNATQVMQDLQNRIDRETRHLDDADYIEVLDNLAAYCEQGAEAKREFPS